MSKGLRYKEKQVVQIEGHPECIFEMKESISTTITINNIEFKLGILSNEKVEVLKTIPQIIITQYKKSKRRALKLPHVISVKTTDTHTLLTVAAKDDENLIKYVNDVHEYLSNHKIESKERCKWTCTTDKKPPIEKPIQVQNQISFPPKKELKLKQPKSPKPLEFPSDKECKDCFYIGKSQCKICENKSRFEQLSAKTKKLKEMTIRMGLT